MPRMRLMVSAFLAADACLVMLVVVVERRQEDHRQDDRQQDKIRYAPLQKQDDAFFARQRYKNAV